MIKTGVIGYGYWGPNIVRNFSANSDISVEKVCDLSEKRLNEVKLRYPRIKTNTDCDFILKDSKLDAVAIVTPVFTHYELAKKALQNNKHIFVEKPFTATSEQGQELIELAEKKELQIMVDHTFIFTGAVRKMKEVLDNDTLGDLYYYDSVRVNLGLFQHDINVIWDLAPHDISIMDFLLDNEKPVSVNAVGTTHVNKRLEDVAYLTINFDNGFIAHFHVNWLSPVKVRKTLVAGDKKMLIWDDLEEDEKIRIYDKGIEVKNEEDVYNLLVQYREGEINIPTIDKTEALELEADYFVNCIKSNKKPVNDGEAGLRVVKVLEASDESVKNNGKEIKL